MREQGPLDGAIAPCEESDYTGLSLSSNQVLACKSKIITCEMQIINGWLEITTTIEYANVI